MTAPKITENLYKSIVELEFFLELNSYESSFPPQDNKKKIAFSSNNLGVPDVSPCLSQYMSRPVWSLLESIWMIQKRIGRMSYGQMKPK